MEHCTYFSCQRHEVDYQGSQGHTDIRVTKTHNISAKHINWHFKHLLSSVYLPKYLNILKVSIQPERAISTTSALPSQKVALKILMLPALTPSTFQTAKCWTVTYQPCWAGHLPVNLSVFLASFLFWWLFNVCGYAVPSLKTMQLLQIFTGLTKKKTWIHINKILCESNKYLGFLLQMYYLIFTPIEYNTSKYSGVW